jgi:hypothetical protein
MARMDWVAGGCAVLLLLPGPATLAAQQLPMEPLRPSGLPISPIYEGWYRNPDGTATLSFGYLNRNTEEVLDVPSGPQNFLEGATVPPQGLPTRFLPRRHYGVLTVTVPAGFAADQKVVWTLDIRGRKFAIPGRLNPLWEIDALGAPATGEKPPALKLDPAGPEAVGPRGVVAGPLRAKVGEPLALSAWATGAEGDSITVHWYHWSGPAPVTFSAAEVPIDLATGKASTMATFSRPGDNVVYVRTNESNRASTGHEQCCWSNGYIKVSVSP